MARKYLAIQIYVQPDELQVARERAAAAGLSISEWGRRQLLGEPTMSEPQTEYTTETEPPRKVTLQLPDGEIDIRVVNGEVVITSDLSLVVMPRAANQVRVKLGR